MSHIILHANINSKCKNFRLNGTYRTVFFCNKFTKTVTVSEQKQIKGNAKLFLLARGM